MKIRRLPCFTHFVTLIVRAEVVKRQNGFCHKCSGAIGQFTEEWMLIRAKIVKCAPLWSLTIFLALVVSGLSPVALAQDAETVSEAAEKDTTEPVFRVSKLNREKAPTKLASSVAVVEATPNMGQVPAEMLTPEAAVAGEYPSAQSPAVQNHPLDKAIELATNGLAKMRASVSDYSAILVKRERVNGVLSSPSYMRVKVRCPRQTESGTTPFSVYMKFLKPRKCAGREVIWVEGQDDNKLCVHESGIMGMKRLHLDPDGWLAMQNNKYPVYDVGLENLMIKLIEKAQRDKSAGMCEVQYRDGVELMKRECSLIELRHQEKKAPYDFHKAQVFIDKELNLPIRFVSYDWPRCPGAEPELIEEYTYAKIALNQGFTDLDFSPDNPAYKYPSR